MNANPVFDRCYKIRCLEWFGVERPTDEHLVPDNPAVNKARVGAYLQAKAQFGLPPVPLGRLA
eukprot:12026591-Heterocapsa_arctica.AAC.1